MAFSNGYTYRKKITVDATKVSGAGSLTDFPVLVSHTDVALKTVANSGKVENASGYDIRFETSGGTELDYERLFYSATTGQIIAWVQATVDGTTSTEIYVYYGNSSISTDQSDPAGTWDANFKAVYHMVEDPSGSAPQILDSTSGNYDLTTAYATAAWASGDSVTGKVHKALDFNGSTDGRYLVNASWGQLTENAARTMEILFKTTNDGNQHYISWGAAGGNNLSALGIYATDIGFLGYGNDNLIDMASNSYNNGAWHHCAITHDGSTMKVIIDGVEKFSGAESLGTDSGDLNIGRFVAGGDYALAVLEEARISSVARSNDWCITTWNTINDPSTFYALGTEETSGAVTTNSNFFMFFN